MAFQRNVLFLIRFNFTFFSFMFYTLCGPNKSTVFQLSKIMELNASRKKSKNVRLLYFSIQFFDLNALKRIVRLFAGRKAWNVIVYFFFLRINNLHWLKPSTSVAFFLSITRLFHIHIRHCKPFSLTSIFGETIGY